MQYIGGKQKSGGHKIAPIVASFAERFGTDEVTEPFCGGLSVTYRLAQIGLKVCASDACEPLIALYRAMLAGWVPPDDVSREDWERLRAVQDSDDPMTAFVGFGCSTSGQWFGSYCARFKRTGANYVTAALAARESLERKLAKCKGVRFEARSYEAVELRGVVYADPPYADALGYPAVGPFDSARFWSWVDDVSRDRPVLVSERTGPDHLTVAGEWSIQSRLTTKSKTRRVERVFVHPRWL